MVKKKSQPKNKIARIDIEIYKLGNVFIGHSQSKTTFILGNEFICIEADE